MSGLNKQKRINPRKLSEYVPGETSFSAHAASDSLFIHKWDFPHILKDVPPLPIRDMHGFGLLVSGGLKGQFQNNGGKWKAAALDYKSLIMSPANENGIGWTWKATCPEDVPLSIIDFHLSPKVLFDVATQALDIDAEKNLEIQHKLNFKDSQLEALTSYIFHEAQVGHPCGQLFMDTAAQMLSLHLVSHYSTLSHRQPKDSVSKLSELQLRNVHDYIESNLAADISLSSLAKVTNLSLYHFSREFKKKTNLSPHQFLIKCRIDRSKELLSSTQMPIELIADQVGIKRLSHFSTLFKRMTGTTPSQYRKDQY